ncbi:PD40 domain-containing protein [Actinoplanes sp. LDG1-06]|uniref:PD40 domain-containing protein n=1 Tax=Paractinoplanes ovalisporus TaxID=2810368 RepID=A0ABS2AFK2_9ACTN|nr:PD40 domain-containing protein [Actinoplanes ovalisporus]MBM2618595.1 PD40 domain-containing protein [Actinoplanes ovalisporus]
MGNARTLFDGQTCRIHVLDVDSGRATLVHEGSEVLFEAPNWTADDQLIVNGDGLLWSLPADGSAPPRRIVLEVPELNNDHVLAPDGETIFLSANDGQLYQAPLTGGPVRRVTANDDRKHFLHGVSPDGGSLAYVGIENLNFDTGTLWTIGADGTGDTRLTMAGSGPDDGPEYSPDGGWIYFNTERFSTAKGHAQIARIRPDGTGLEQLTSDERVNWFPHPSPDGDRTVYLSFPPGTQGHPADRTVELRLVEGDSWHAPRILAELPGGQGTINVNSWSPYGRRFAYVDYPLKQG